MKRTWMPMAEDSCIVYPPGGEGDPKEVTNLGWILRHWQDVDWVDVRRVYATDGLSQYRSTWDCILSVWLRDGRVFVTPFASSAVLLDWLDRPVFRGRPLNWFGYEGVCGGEKHRSIVSTHR